MSTLGLAQQTKPPGTGSSLPFTQTPHRSPKPTLCNSAVSSHPFLTGAMLAVHFRPLCRVFPSSGEALPCLSPSSVPQLLVIFQFETTNKTKRQQPMGEDICKQQLWQGVNIQNIWITHTIQHQTNQLKSGQRTWTGISSKKTYKWPTNIWKDAEFHYY